jgi:hypothetical protein
VQLEQLANSFAQAVARPRCRALFLAADFPARIALLRNLKSG